MSDTIYRQAAIDAVNDLTYPSDLMDVKRILVNIPSAEQRWIPVSERLPDKREMVIIWIDMPKQPFVQRSIHMAFAWLEPDARTGELYWMDRHFTKIDDGKVIAWRELPEPYQAERREDECSD